MKYVRRFRMPSTLFLSLGVRIGLGESRPPDVRKSFGFKTKEIHE